MGASRQPDILEETQDQYFLLGGTASRLKGKKDPSIIGLTNYGARGALCALAKAMNLITTEWYNLLVDECKDIVTESVFTSRWALVEGYHMLGHRIREDEKFKEHEKGNKSSLQDLAQKIGMSRRTLYYALQFFDKYPDLNTVPEGKNISWNKIITKYLPEHKKEKEVPVHTCPNCDFQWS